ncbi:MAG: VCBS repeat-containing protein [Myxococcales bacterium]|nr:VCBS repeat-containing protein [Myxococcales bacterium]
MGLALSTWMATASANAKVASHYWPQLRHDAQNSNFNPGTANLASPGVRWRMPLTAPPTNVRGLDADLDGVDDLLFATSGRLVVRTVRGKLLWQSAVLGISGVASVVDLDGDGFVDVLASSGNAAHVFDGITGKLRWSTPVGLFPQLVVLASGHFTSKATRQIAVASVGNLDLSSSGATHIYGFVDGKVQELAVTANAIAESPCKMALGQQFVDVDGDGLTDVLLPGAYHYCAYSGKTGALLAMSPKLPALAGIWIATTNVPAITGKPPLIVVQSSNDTGAPTQKSVGFQVLQLVGTTLKIVSATLDSDPTKTAQSLVQGAAGDLDGDGQQELLVSHYVNEQWQFEAHDLPSGATLEVVKAVAGADSKYGPVLQAVVQGNKPYLVFSLQTERVVDQFAPVAVATWSRTGKLALGPPLLQACTLSRALEQPPADLGAALQQVVPLLVHLDPANPTSKLALICDTDADNRSDKALVVEVTAQPALAVAQEINLGPGGTLATPVRGPDSGGKPTWRLTGFHNDGRVSVWDATGAVVNDNDNDGVADLHMRIGVQATFSIAPWQDQQTVPAMVITEGTRVVAVDLTDAGPASPPKQLWSLSPAPGYLRANLSDTDGDGQREVVMRFRPPKGTATVRVVDKLGKSPPDFVLPGPAARWGQIFGDGAQFEDFDGDGVDDLLVTVLPVSGWPTDFTALNIYSFKKNQYLWPTTAACAGLGDTVFGYDDSPGAARLLASQYYSRFACSPATGAIIAKKSFAVTTYGVPMVADLDGQAPLDLVQAGGYAGNEAYVGADFALVWSQPDMRYSWAPAAMAKVGDQWLHVQLLPQGSGIHVRELKTGKLKWAQWYHKGKAYDGNLAAQTDIVAAGLIAVGDLTGKGEPAAVFRTSDGLLYAVSLLDGAVFWTLNFGGSIGDPVAADIDGDGQIELVLSVPSGEVIAIDGNVATPPAWVRDHGPAGPALAAEAEIDLQEESNVLRANWATSPGATAYFVRIVDDSGGEQVPQTNVQLVTSHTFDDLYLQPGKTYFFSVAASASIGADASVSSATVSDGVAIVDQSPPQWIDLKCAPSCVIAQGTTMTVSATAVDKTRLHKLQVDYERKGEVSPIASYLTGATSYAVQHTRAWTSAGIQRVWFAATDTAGHVGQASLQVQVCADTEVVAQGKCALPSATPTAAAPAVKSLSGAQVEDCRAHRRAGSAAAVCIALTSCWIALLLRRRQSVAVVIVRS